MGPWLGLIVNPLLKNMGPGSTIIFQLAVARDSALIMLLSTLTGITQSFDASLLFLREHRVLPSVAPTCGVCGREMTLVKDSTRRLDGHVFRCPAHKGTKTSIRAGSFLADANIALAQFIQLVFLWSHRIPVTTTINMIELSEPTVIQWYSRFRDVCSNYYEGNDYRIGGPGRIVEIDESVVSRRKYNCGRLVRERWVFGGVDTTTKLCFLVFVEDRSAATLLPLIVRYIDPGSEIWSDGWAAYGGIPSIDVAPRFIHRVVNHSENFVAPNTGVTTNHMERMWCEAKRQLKRMNGTNDDMLPGHMDEFMWRGLRGRDAWMASTNLLNDIASWYRV